MDGWAIFSVNGVEHMDTMDTQWMWFYMADCGRWHRVEDGPDKMLTSEELERYYRQNPQGSVTKRTSGTQIQLNFTAMLYTDLNTGKQRRIQRGNYHEKSCSCFSAAPEFWENTDASHPYQLKELREGTPEYQTVQSYVRKDGLLDKPIVSIQRIQNTDLWEIFCRKRKQLMRLKGVQDIEERRLFHGTKVENIDSICKYNFDLRLAGSNGHVYGRGIYFAKHATHADKYSYPAGWTGTKTLFLARVLTGKVILGQSHFKKPDHGCTENTHDSCVDDVDNPKIFVIFDPNQIYPEYIVEYR